MGRSVPVGLVGFGEGLHSPSRGSSKSHAIAASLHVDFGDLFVSERSSYEGYTEIFVAQLTTPSRVDLLVAKNT